MKKVCGTKMKRIRLLIMNNTTELGIPLRLNLSNPGPSDLRAKRSTSERLSTQAGNLAIGSTQPPRGAD